MNTKRKRKSTATIPLIFYRKQELLAIVGNLMLDGVGLAEVSLFKEDFERAAFWRDSMLGYRRLIPDCSLEQHLKVIRTKSENVVRHGLARLTHLGQSHPLGGQNSSFASLPQHRSNGVKNAVHSLTMKLTVDPGCVPDGFRDARIAEALSDQNQDGGDFEQILIQLVEELHGYVRDPVLAVKAAAQIKEGAEAGLKSVQNVKDILRRFPDTSDAAISGWIDDMIDIYAQITGRTDDDDLLSFSRIKPGEVNSGEPTGPLIRFLISAANPLDWALKPEQCAQYLKTYRKHRAEVNCKKQAQAQKKH